VKIQYSPDVDVLYIRLRESKISNSDELAADIILDFDENGSPVGIEILAASGKTDLQEYIIQAPDSGAKAKPD
jgi:uncharacterized protein YuzE